ncbi:MAG: hypothetical protein HQL67_03720 [Magnetococcales bacterium]|nr:hypothetical protein [Magnetococcales bacterium]
MNLSDSDRKRTVVKPQWYQHISALAIYYRILGVNAVEKVAAKGTPLWWILALCWGGLSFVVLSNYYQSQTNPIYMNELWFLLSLLWAQFGFAVAFGALANRNIPLLIDKLFMAVFPPLILHFAIFTTVM